MSGKRGTFSRVGVRGGGQVRVGLVLLSIAVGSPCTLQAGPVAATQSKKILDKPVEYFETGLAISSSSYVTGYWIDSRQLLITALPRGVAEEDRGPPTRVPTRVVLVDFALKRWKEIATDAAVMGFDQETLEAVIGARRGKSTHTLRAPTDGGRKKSPADRVT